MPVNISGAAVEGDGSAFAVRNTSGTVVFRQGVSTYGGNVFGFMENSNVPGFVAGSTDATYKNTTSGWQKLNDMCNVTVYNRGSCYNTSTTRFTAPVTGPYLFITSSWGAAYGYTHPMFAVNADVTGRRNSTPYKIRHHGLYDSQGQDIQIQETIYLYSGDYVEVYVYHDVTTNSFYKAQTYFAGAYVG